MYPSDLKYTSEHEWLRLQGNRGVVGITHYAQDQLGDVVYVSLPAVGSKVQQGQPFGEVESVKTASDLYAPVSGTVVRVNERLVDQNRADYAPELINRDPYGEGWMIEVEIADPGEVDALLSADAYQAQLPD